MSKKSKADNTRICELLMEVDIAVAKIAELEAKLDTLERVRADQVEELLSREQTHLSDIAELLTRTAGYKAKCDARD
jgi:hypothetical protein